MFTTQLDAVLCQATRLGALWEISWSLMSVRHFSSICANRRGPGVAREATLWLNCNWLTSERATSEPRMATRSYQDKVKNSLMHCLKSETISYQSYPEKWATSGKWAVVHSPVSMYNAEIHGNIVYFSTYTGITLFSHRNKSQSDGYAESSVWQRRKTEIRKERCNVVAE